MTATELGLSIFRRPVFSFLPMRPRPHGPFHVALFLSDMVQFFMYITGPLPRGRSPSAHSFILSITRSLLPSAPAVASLIEALHRSSINWFSLSQFHKQSLEGESCLLPKDVDGAMSRRNMTFVTAALRTLQLTVMSIVGSELGTLLQLFSCWRYLAKQNQHRRRTLCGFDQLCIELHSDEPLSK